MTKITAKIASLKEAIQNALTGLKEAWETEPVSVLTAAASTITFVFAKFGVPINGSELLEALEFIVPILVTGIWARKKVTPVAKLKRAKAKAARAEKASRPTLGSPR